MTQLPTLETKRLRLRPFTLDDAPEAQRLAGDRDIASRTLAIPHLYEDGVAEWWIATHHSRHLRGVNRLSWPSPDRQHGLLVGAVGLTVNRQHESAELGYWVGKPFWNRGYATEAGRAMLACGFDVLGLNRIHACHFKRNLASRRVIQKIGMRREGCLRQQIKKWGQFEDMEDGILRDESS